MTALAKAGGRRLTWRCGLLPLLRRPVGSGRNEHPGFVAVAAVSRWRRRRLVCRRRWCRRIGAARAGSGAVRAAVARTTAAAACLRADGRAARAAVAPGVPGGSRRGRSRLNGVPFATERIWSRMPVPAVMVRRPVSGVGGVLPAEFGFDVEGVGARRRSCAYPPQLIIISENKDTAIGFPVTAGAIAIEGDGKAGPPAISQLDWVRECPHLHYWGDIDAEGFEIVNSYRAAGLDISTVLMDDETYQHYKQFGTRHDRRGNSLAIRESPRPIVAQLTRTADVSHPHRLRPDRSATTRARPHPALRRGGGGARLADTPAIACSQTGNGNTAAPFIRHRSRNTSSVSEHYVLIRRWGAEAVNNQ